MIRWRSSQFPRPDSPSWLSLPVKVWTEMNFHHDLLPTERQSSAQAEHDAVHWVPFSPFQSQFLRPFSPANTISCASLAPGTQPQQHQGPPTGEGCEKESVAPSIKSKGRANNPSLVADGESSLRHPQPSFAGSEAEGNAAEAMPGLVGTPGIAG